MSTKRMNPEFSPRTDLKTDVQANPKIQPTRDARQTFETALARLSQSKSGRAAHTPIFVRSDSRGGNDPFAEKRVLADAARALARLWNVAPAVNH
jgi:hypothetical protein